MIKIELYDSYYNRSDGKYYIKKKEKNLKPLKEPKNKRSKIDN